jgi:hypothetical protein
MPADYAEVLRDLDAQIASLEAEVATLKAGRPTIVLLRNKYSPLTVQIQRGPYVDMGPTDAIPLVLKNEPFGLTTAEIATKLQAGGIKSSAQNFGASVSATLSQLKDKKIVRKIGDDWMLEHVPAPPPTAPEFGDSGITDDDIPF